MVALWSCPQSYRGPLSPAYHVARHDVRVARRRRLAHTAVDSLRTQKCCHSPSPLSLMVAAPCDQGSTH